MVTNMWIPNNRVATPLKRLYTHSRLPLGERSLVPIIGNIALVLLSYTITRLAKI